MLIPYSLPPLSRQHCHALGLHFSRDPPPTLSPSPTPRVTQAFPDGRPLFCISVGKNGPYDFVPYARIKAGLPPSPATDAVSKNTAVSSTEEGDAVEQDHVVHDRWQNLYRDDPEGLRAVVDFLEARLMGYPRSSVRGGGSGGMRCSGDGDNCGVCGGEGVDGSQRGDSEASLATVERGIRVSEALPKIFVQ